MFQSSSEVAEWGVVDRRAWGQSGTYSLQGLIDGVGVLEQPPSGWLPAG